jgi:hypothetical protein
MKPSQPHSLITHPPCPDCCGPTTLYYIEPADPGYDNRLFRCVACGCYNRVIVKIESAPLPLKAIDAERSA